MPESIPRIILIGHPNVGKSQLFNLLTGSYVAVSNYPGTTVELSQGKGVIAGRPVKVVDSPGLYSLQAISEEEQVTRLLLFQERPSLVIQVVDARNLLRMLNLTLELVEAQLPLVLVVNMVDEALSSGLIVNCRLLFRRFGIPVIPSVLVAGSGLQSIKKAIATCLWGGRSPRATCQQPSYSPLLEAEIQRFSSQLQGRYGVSRRAVTLALLNPDPGLERLVALREGKPLVFKTPRRDFTGNTLLHLAKTRRELAARLLKSVVQSAPPDRKQQLAEHLNRLLVSPLGGGIILGLVLYFGFYRFVGVIGAQVLVELLEERLFLGVVSPWLNFWGELFLPWPWLQELLLADYGILSLGLRYTFTVILPIMTTFFLFFSVIEDSGYLPRAAYLINLYMEKIGLNGKSVIPLSLGLGCGTLAILSTRTLESRRERLRVCIILSLAVPCSAQLGLILALLAPGVELVIWLAAVLSSFFVAACAGRLLFRGEAAP
ncbi:MAG TPA: ferrous iron transporter B, partial [Firmicutes bacterium]|nr:ferrous iron transporter B [Bacillota bacterium]